jgi:hypothetical protein
MESVWIFPGKPVLLTDSARPFVLALAEWKGQNDGTGMGWHFQHARSPQIPWLIIIFAIKFAILDYPPGLGKPIYHCCRCLHHSKPALPICNVNGQTAKRPTFGQLYSKHLESPPVNRQTDTFGLSTYPQLFGASCGLHIHYQEWLCATLCLMLATSHELLGNRSQRKVLQLQ